MKTSSRGITLIQAHEGLRLKVYKDAAGLPTIGYGHLVKAGEAFPKGITIYEANDLLKADLADAEKAVSDLVTVKLKQTEFDALVSFTFNLGRAALARSTLLKKLNAGDRLGAAAEFQKWINAGGKPLKGLLRRRLSEAALFLSD